MGINNWVCGDAQKLIRSYDEELVGVSHKINPTAEIWINKSKVAILHPSHQVVETINDEQISPYKILLVEEYYNKRLKSISAQGRHQSDSVWISWLRMVLSRNGF